MSPSLSAAMTFEAVRLLAITGWRLSVRALIWLAVGAAAFTSLMVFTLGFLAFRLLCVLEAEHVVSSTSAPGTITVLLATAAVVYVAGGVCLREALGPRRRALRANPNRGLFRALDVEMRHVFVASSGPRAAFVLLASAALTGSALAALAVQGWAPPLRVWVLTALPVSAVLAVLALGAWLATHGERPAGIAKRVATLGLCGVALATPAYLVTRALGDGRGFGEWTLPNFWEPLAAATTTAFGLAAAITALFSWNRMAGESFPLGHDSTGSSAPRRGETRSLTAALWRGIVRSRHRSAIMSTASTLTLAASVAMGVRLGGWHAEEWGPSKAVANLLPWLTFVVSLTVAELLAKENGPAVLAPRLRVLWENGLTLSSLVGGVLATHTAFTLVVLLPGLMVAGWAVTGGLLWTAPPMIVATVAASLLGGCVSRTAMKQADGSADVSLAAALLTLVAAAPAALISLAPGPLGVAGGTLYTLALLGVVALCLRRRILRLPSASLT